MSNETDDDWRGWVIEIKGVMGGIRWVGPFETEAKATEYAEANHAGKTWRVFDLDSVIGKTEGEA